MPARAAAAGDVAAGAVAVASRESAELGRFYLTTAIDYANGDPHLGHAFEKIGADAIARYRRLCGDDVHFLIGMDEHGQKVASEAADRGVEPQRWSTRSPMRFQAMWKRLSISNDQFIRTTAADHHAGVQALIERIFEKSPDDFYEKEYEGWYCVGCESFKQDNEIIQGKCVLHPTRTLQWVAEKNWFFRLSAYSDRLRELIGENRFSRSEEPAQRDARAARSGARGHFGKPVALLVGSSLPSPVERRRDADDVRVVRCASELSHRDWISGPKASRIAGLPICTLSARTSRDFTRSSGRRC